MTIKTSKVFPPATSLSASWTDEDGNGKSLDCLVLVGSMDEVQLRIIAHGTVVDVPVGVLRELCDEAEKLAVRWRKIAALVEQINEQGQ